MLPAAAAPALPASPPAAVSKPASKRATMSKPSAAAAGSAVVNAFTDRVFARAAEFGADVARVVCALEAPEGVDPDVWKLGMEDCDRLRCVYVSSAVAKEMDRASRGTCPCACVCVTLCVCVCVCGGGGLLCAIC